MKDFISKVTFGFIMAQLLPGVVVVFAITYAAIGGCKDEDQNLMIQLANVTALWFSSTFAMAAFGLTAVAIGMLIHGLNWAILAWLENQEDPGHPKPVRTTSWHKWHLWKQLISAPLIMIYEILHLLFKARNLDSLTMDENISHLKADQVTQFQFLQDFYLHFGQFFAHMAYAFLVALACFLICCIRSPSWSEGCIVFGVYLITGLFYLLGRIQLSSLFKGETTLRKYATKANTTENMSERE